MKKSLLPILAFTTALLLSPGKARAETDSESLQRLGRHLTTIETQAHNERLIGGTTLSVLGAAGGVGFFLARDSSDSYTRDTLAPILGISGGIFLVLGVLQFVSKSEYETLPAEFRLIPDSDGKAKVTAGEDMLRHLAARSRRERLIGAGSMTAVGAAEIIWYAASSSSQPTSNWLLYNGILFAGLGIVYFFVPRPPEEENNAYREWKYDRKHASLPRFTLMATGGLPVPALHWRF